MQVQNGSNEKQSKQLFFNDFKYFTFLTALPTMIWRKHNQILQRKGMDVTNTICTLQICHERVWKGINRNASCWYWNIFSICQLPVRKLKLIEMSANTMAIFQSVPNPAHRHSRSLMHQLFLGLYLHYHRDEEICRNELRWFFEKKWK